MQCNHFENVPISRFSFYIYANQQYILQEKTNAH